MKILVLDDEQFALDNLTMTLKEIPEFTEVEAFRSPNKAREWLTENRVDIAFLDINMKQMDGLTMAKYMKERQPDCFIIFVTGYSQYALQAIQMHASGYLLKPVDVADIQRELSCILNPPKRPVIGNVIRVQCFGNFEVFINNEPMRFQYSKTKELLAYLIDRRGAFCTNGEIISVLWAEAAELLKKNSYFRDLRSDLIAGFRSAGCADAIQKQRGRIAIVPNRFECDYFNWIKGEIEAINAYKGEYMAQYSWGEFTLGGLH